MAAEVSAYPQMDPTKAVLSVIHQRIGTQKFNAWFKNGTHISVDNEDVKVGAANPFIAGWIESHFADDLAAAGREVTGRRKRVTISVDPTLSGRLHRNQLDLQANLVDRGTAGTARHRHRPASKLRYKLEDFVTGSSNKLAYSAAMAVTGNSKAPFNPLFIHGACGVGKTHLLQGICNAVAKNHGNGKNISWKYLTAERFTNEFIQGIRHKRTETFRRTYRRLDLLVIDDVHFLAAKKATQEEFLHTFNAIHADDKQIVMASDAHPRLLGRLTEQLVSRFLSGMVVRIEPPDRSTRIRILQKLSDGLKLAAPQDVLDYIALHIHGSVRELEGTLVKLSALAKLAGEPVTLNLARHALADYLVRTDSAVTLGGIETVISAFFGITPADMHSSRRTHTVSLARAFAMFLARRYTRMSFPEIGQFMGKNHSSAVLAVQRIEKMLADEHHCCRWMTPAGPKTIPAKTLLETLTKQIS
ncbi:MAG: chromosomal replication initiator protein DnaA [Phycisphaerae bacterium]|nr:chromosomal replication initiator protein DnaA [Phycisphaerae bacterium]